MLFKSIFVVLGFGVLLAGCSASQVAATKQLCSAVIAATPENTVMAAALGVPALEVTAGNMIISGDCAVVQSFPTVPVPVPAS